MALCTDTFTQGWTVVIRLLFKPFRLIFWIKMAFLVFFAEVFSSLSMEFLQQFDLMAKMEADPDSMMEILPEIIAFLMGFILIVIVYSLLNAATRVLFYDAVLRGASYYGKAFGRHLSTIVSYFLWNIIASILLIVFAIIALIIIAVIAGLLAAAMNSEGIIVLAGFAGLGLVLLMLFVGLIYWIILDGMVLPLMVTSDLGIFAAWGKSLRLIFSHFGGFIGFAFIRSIVSLTKITILIVVNLIMMFAVFGFSLQEMVEGQETMGQNLTMISFMIPLGYFLSLILLPIPILRDCYSLSFIAALTGGSDKPSPEGDKPTNSHSTKPGTAPSSEVPPVFQGPTSFSDIPTQTQEPDEDTGDTDNRSISPSEPLESPESPETQESPSERPPDENAPPSPPGL